MNDEDSTFSSQQLQHDHDAAQKEKQKRGYRACLHCRARKAKCDLGDIDAPSDPPCSRCRREKRECVFAPSRRGGNNSKRRRETDDSTPAIAGAGPQFDHPPPAPQQQHSYPAPPHVDVLNPSPKNDTYLFNHPSVSSNEMSPATTGPSPLTAHAHLQPGSVGSSNHGGSSHAPGDTKRRRLHLNPPLHTSDPSSIVVADVQNESDALHILALASANRPPSSGAQSPGHRPQHSGTITPAHRAPLAAARIEDFDLVRLGIVNEGQVSRLTSAFFLYYHHLFPMVPADRIPRTPEQLAEFARSERYLVTAMVIIASKHDRADGMREVHERSWSLMRGWISEIVCLGAPPTVGLVEALLLLAENIPRDPPIDATNSAHAQGFGEEVHTSENRQAWMLIGMAIRCAYGLGLDKLALKLIPEVDRTYDVERARLVWTYCYLFDRHVSLRLGKAFWSRGPNVCFQGFSASSQTGPAAAPGNFPFLREATPSPGSDAPTQEDFASLVQTYLELTQLMSNAHDILYPNAARTRSLVVYGEYFKYIDELTRSLDGFRILWHEKKWSLFPLNDAVQAMFYYTQLYICAFSFQAHVERAAMRAEEEYKLHEGGRRPALSLFPRGSAASPDARYINVTIMSAQELLRICIDKMYKGGALPYLPNRFLLWFTYAAIVLLKAMYSGAMSRTELPEASGLIDQLCECLIDASPDDDHPAVRYGLQLKALKKSMADLDISVSSPAGGGTLPLPPADSESRHPRDTHEPTRTTNGREGRDIPDLETAAHQGVPWLNEEQWFPAQSAAPHNPISFTYSTPAGVPRPHEQPVSEVINLQPRGSIGMGVDNNLGFPTFDWLGLDPGNSGPMGAAPPANPFDGVGFTPDFWMKVTPGEGQGGFPFR
ncbi:uncharacterized protein CcaverHIS019_0702290 [Cutaneotrichosporon cavernicola]|uniref:Zn(2)-C6 fungal-type domain-containing protein n=1 Tax=Cutaneotrichosporon cavernicola TaxID=279322 RepID=A0AA48LA45_9TREE|nr:uncharacterized protein CcaverHIS019_0702290 [Cutaneotrichosporon cavernicola]BEI94648.1 hypothetical protein CcaverHIS019_0702290 [Cutaneotrichosporon cavernicola]BEJ02424.1 hypothetical protein CcaverHIS631_0702190 [Cutaneotrichosporon cavernicola]BEJ10183.1 hypothetical protein CcaverHIS641_0702180 [Cutaneotrichosporon cavernicola]